jgi:hypothetical protein
MQTHSEISPSVNGSKPPVNGRGLAHRKLSRKQRLSLAADLATRQCRLDPSLGQISAITGMPVAAIRAEIKARAVQADAHATGRKAEAEAIDTLLDDVPLGHLLERVIDRFDVFSMLEELNAQLRRRGFAEFVIMAPDTEPVTIEPDYLAAQ